MIKKKVLFQVSRSLLRSCGLDIVRWDVGHELFRRKKLMNVAGIDLVLDVGANIGQFATQIRNIGYRGRIISCEPNSRIFDELRQASRKDVLWDVLQIALGRHVGKAQLNIASNNQSSSISNLYDKVKAKNMGIEFVSAENVDVSTVDDIIAMYKMQDSKIMLKVDTQGFEREVLDGARSSLKDIMLIQIEAPILKTYDGHFSLGDALKELENSGFTPVSFEHGWSSEITGRVFEVDIIFANNILELNK